MSKTALGIELGSTRIKAIAINDKHIPVYSATTLGSAPMKTVFEHFESTSSLL